MAVGGISPAGANHKWTRNRWDGMALVKSLGASFIVNLSLTWPCHQWFVCSFARCLFDEFEGGMESMWESVRCLIRTSHPSHPHQASFDDLSSPPILWILVPSICAFASELVWFGLVWLWVDRQTVCSVARLADGQLIMEKKDSLSQQRDDLMSVAPTFHRSGRH